MKGLRVFCPTAARAQKRRRSAPTPLRFPVFSRRSNPAIDPPILRKSRVYVEAQVASRLADWVDPNDMRKGIICREFLPSQRPELAPVPDDPTKIPAHEIPGVYFEEPVSVAWLLEHRLVKLNRRVVA